MTADATGGREPTMVRYCVGFLFSEDEERVLLVRKAKPKWMAGMWNGVGGKAEPGESVAASMVREFAEETGRTDSLTWEHFATLGGPDFEIGFFRATGDSLSCPDVNDVGESLADVLVCQIADRSVRTVPNLRWLIPMAMSSSRHDWPYLIGERGFNAYRAPGDGEAREPMSNVRERLARQPCDCGDQYSKIRLDHVSRHLDDWGRLRLHYGCIRCGSYWLEYEPSGGAVSERDEVPQ